MLFSCVNSFNNRIVAMDSCEEINIIKGILNARCRDGATVEDIKGKKLQRTNTYPPGFHSFTNNGFSFARRFHGIHWYALANG